MLRYLFKFTIRGLIRNRTFTAINIIGLSLGLTAFMLIHNYTAFEKSYEAHVPDHENIYRVTRLYESDNSAQYANNFAALGPDVTLELPQVENHARLILTDKIYSNFALSYFGKGVNAITFNHDKAFFADQGVIDLFLHDWISGDRANALNAPNQVVLSRSEAAKYFGEGEAIGKTLKLNGGQSLKVSGVFEDQPQNSHLNLKVLCSMKSLPENWNLDHEWGWGNFHTYLKVSNTQGLAESIHEIASRHLQQGEGLPSHFPLQPLASIHLESEALHEIQSNGSAQSVRFLDIIAWVILFIATINFINLFTARSIERIKEVSLKKVIGSSQLQMLAQFMMEVLVVSVIACTVAFTATQFLVHPLHNLLGIKFSADWTMQLINAGLFILLLSAVAFYPSLWLSRKGSFGMVRKVASPVRGISVRHVLVTTQFALTSLLLIGTSIIYDQKQYMIEKPSGFNKDQMLVVSLPSTITDNREYESARFINVLDQDTRFGTIGRVAHLPGYEVTRMRWIYRQGQPANDGTYPKVIAADEGFFKSLNHQLLAGRFFSKDFVEDSSIVLNEKAITDLGFQSPEEAVGTNIFYENRLHKVIGVVANYHQQSLKSDFNPIVFLPMPWLFQYYTVPLKGGQLEESINVARQQYAELYPNDHFEFFFLDTYFNLQYQQDIRFGQITAIFSGLAIFIALFGLSGLTLFAVDQRIKEISVRKVLGASFQQLLWLFNSSFTKLILIAFVLSAPLAYYLMNDWLTTYSYRISLQWTHFMIPLSMVLGLALAITAAVVVRFANVNPAETLRND
ncbi:MAG: FtsX-like permease family protein [Cytophagales bacterium]|nr:FtsX-like permease family protein [Cytophagales bacterium]